MTQFSPIVKLLKAMRVIKEVIMGKINKKHMLFVMILGIFLLTGCNKFRFDTFNASDEKDTGTKVTLAPEDNQKEAIANNKELETTITPNNETISTENATPTPEPIQPIANNDLTVYTVNVDTGDIETVTALVPQDSEITPELIVTTVVESMEDQSVIIGIESVTTKKDAVIVSFYKDKAPLVNVGGGYEAAILDAIAQSLLDNLEDYSKVIYRVEGNAYESDHFEFGINDVYFEEN